MGTGRGKGIVFDFCDEGRDNRCAMSAENERWISFSVSDDKGVLRLSRTLSDESDRMVGDNVFFGNR